jgi:hypothetical protein
LRCWSIETSNFNSGEYLHREFYRKAANCSLKKVDVFLIDGEVMALPCENELSNSGRFKDANEVSQDD